MELSKVPEEKKDEAQWRKGGVNYLGGWTVRDDPDRPKAQVNGNIPFLSFSMNLSSLPGL